MVLKKIALGLLISLLVMVALVVQAGIAIVDIRTPDTRLWIPVPLLLGHIAGEFVDLPLNKDEDLKEFMEYRPLIAELLKQFKNLPDVELVSVERHDEQVRIYKQADALYVKVNAKAETVQVRIPLKTIEKMTAVLESPHMTVGDLVACLEWQASGDLVRVENAHERVRISIL
jgi:hypothetical protein